MNYCTIQEAWGKNNISNNFTEYMSNTTIEGFTNNNNNNNDNDNNNDIKYDINYENNDCDINCEKIILHLKKCKKCRNKIKKYLKSNINDFISTLIEENKDIIILILVTIFILLFINLINNITKS